jgi:hypothetical protein
VLFAGADGALQKVLFQQLYKVAQMLPAREIPLGDGLGFALGGCLLGWQR